MLAKIKLTFSPQNNCIFQKRILVLLTYFSTNFILMFAQVLLVFLKIKAKWIHNFRNSLRINKLQIKQTNKQKPKNIFWTKFWNFDHCGLGHSVLWKGVAQKQHRKSRCNCEVGVTASVLGQHKGQEKKRFSHDCCHQFFLHSFWLPIKRWRNA